MMKGVSRYRLDSKLHTSYAESVAMDNRQKSLMIKLLRNGGKISKSEGPVSERGQEDREYSIGEIQT